MACIVDISCYSLSSHHFEVTTKNAKKWLNRLLQHQNNKNLQKQPQESVLSLPKIHFERKKSIKILQLSTS
jgi:hypothetical protein